MAATVEDRLRYEDKIEYGKRLVPELISSRYLLMDNARMGVRYRPAYKIIGLGTGDYSHLSSKPKNVFEDN